MSDAAEVAIEAALLERAVAFAAAQSPALAISLPNIRFSSPAVSETAKWLRASILPADTFALGINSAAANQHYGILQLDTFYGLGGGEIVPLRIASDIIAYFKRGTTMSRDGFVVEITQPPWRAAAVQDDPWLMIPVRIPYLAFAYDPT